jgi:hypothetical protein
MHTLAASYISGNALVQPAPDVCRVCHLTSVCRRLELAAVDVANGDGA